MQAPIRRLVKRLLFVLLLLASGLYLSLSPLVGFGLQHWLRGQGFSEVSLGTVDFAPFAGELRLKQLLGRREGGQLFALGDGYINVDWLVLPRRHIQLQGLVLSGLELSISRDSQGRFAFSGLPLPADDTAASDSEPWGIGLDHLAIKDSLLLLKLPGFQHRLQLDSLTLDGLRSWEAEQPAQLSLAARLDGTPIQIEGELLPLAATPGGQLRLRIHGLPLAALIREQQQAHAGLLPADLQLQAGTLDTDLHLAGRLVAGRPAIKQTGRVTLHGLQLLQQGQRQALGRLRWNGGLRWSPDGHLQLDGTLAADDLQLQLADADQTLQQLHWQGKLDWRSKDGLHITGPILLHGLALNGQGRHLTLASLDWQGMLAWAAGSPRAEGSLQAKDLQVTQPAQQLLLASLEQLSMPQLQLDETQWLTIAAIDLQAPQLLQNQGSDQTAPLARATTVHIGSSRLHRDKAVVLGKVSVRDADIHLTRAADGGIRDLQQLRAGQPPAEKTAATPSAKLPLAVAGVELKGQSQLSFEDHSVTPVFRQQLKLDKLTLGALDSGALNKWTALALSGQLGEYSRVALAGRARPFTDKLNVELTGNVQRLDLPPLSGYTASKLGYNLQSGQLDSDIDIKINDDQLDGVVKLVLNELTVKPADRERLAQLTRELSMPLDSALNMLRDGNDNIRLKLPVSGDIHNPDFDLSNLINKALGSALKTAALAYLKHTLQPYGALITLAELAGKAANRVALDAIPFQAGSATPASSASPYLDKLDGLLSERPQLRVQICGLASEADRQALLGIETTRRAQASAAEGTYTLTAPQPPPLVKDETLLQLAEQRAANIKRLLVKRGIAPERLFVCNPEIDKASKAQPRVELLL
jgi:hypothetical protein